MEKWRWILMIGIVSGIAIFVSGCGKEDVNATYGSQTMENSNIIMDTETGSQTEAGQEDSSNYDDSDELGDYMTSIKEQSDIIKKSLEHDALTQMDMNLKSQELYELWDDELNYLWGKLKSSLPEDEFSKLLDEQRKWISEKEKSVEDAGKEFEGGSMHALVVNTEAAKITEERVYELYELLMEEK